MQRKLHYKKQQLILLLNRGDSSSLSLKDLLGRFKNAFPYSSTTEPTSRGHLQALIKSELVELGPDAPAGRGRPAQTFQLTDDGQKIKAELLDRLGDL